MKLSRYILGGMAALALLVAIPVHAEMAVMADSDLDGIAAKGNASVTFGGFGWGDLHSTDVSDHKGGLDNNSPVTITGVNTGNVWGAYAGSESFGVETADFGGSTTSSATSNAGIGGF